MWEVVGGGDKGGILVREGQALDSPEAKGRLSTGALIEEVSLEGTRLHFTRISGTGPDAGWVSLKLKDKELVVKKDRKPQSFYDLSAQDITGRAVDFASLRGKAVLVGNVASK